MEIEYSKQINKLFLSSRVVGDLAYKKDVNWESNDAKKRERANTMFSRINQGIYNIANDMATFNVDYDEENDCFKYSFTDKFGYFLFDTYIDENNVLSFFIEEFVFTYKQDKDSWWAIVDKKQNVRYPFLTRILDCRNKHPELFY